MIEKARQGHSAETLVEIEASFVAKPFKKSKKKPTYFQTVMKNLVEDLMVSLCW